MFDYKVILYTTCKPFQGDDAWRQEQAIRSWKLLKGPEIKIIVIGNDLGVKEICQKYDLIHRPDVNLFEGVPLVRDMINIGCSYAEEKDYLIWTNCDMIYFNDLIETIDNFNNLRKKRSEIKNFMLCGRRHDWANIRVLENFDKEEITSLLNFKNHDITIKKDNDPDFKVSLHAACGMDYFIHNRSMYENKVPPKLVIAGTRHDLFLATFGIRNGFSCDTSETIFCLHQNHDSYHGNPMLYEKLRRNNHSNLQLNGVLTCSKSRFKSVKKNGAIIFFKK